MNRIGEECLRSVILPELEMGRADWDRPHTELVVAYVKEIVAVTTDLDLDEEVLVPAAYGHDWGYVGLFDGAPTSIDAIRAKKSEHMRIGAQKMAALLNRGEFSYLSEAQKLRICHLVLVHDEVAMLDDPDELVLMEADTLAAFDGTGTRSVFSVSERQRWEEKAMYHRVPWFVTAYSREKIKELAGGGTDPA